MHTGLSPNIASRSGAYAKRRRVTPTRGPRGGRVRAREFDTRNKMPAGFSRSRVSTIGVSRRDHSPTECRVQVDFVHERNKSGVVRRRGVNAESGGGFARQILLLLVLVASSDPKAQDPRTSSDSSVGGAPPSRPLITVEKGTVTNFTSHETPTTASASSAPRSTCRSPSAGAAKPSSSTPPIPPGGSSSNARAPAARATPQCAPCWS